MARASGRFFFSAETTSRPLPSPSRKSTTAKAGAALPICARPSETLSHDVTEKPRVSMARDSRSRNGLSSSTMRSERSVCWFSSAMAFKVLSSLQRIHIWRRNQAVPRPQMVDRRISATQGRGLSYCFLEGLDSLKTLPRPRDLDHCSVFRERPIGKRDLGAGTFQQGAGDEHAESQAAACILGAPPREVWLADPLDQVGRNAGAVVGDHHLNGIGVPP